MAFLISPLPWSAYFESVLTERTSELDSVLEPCSGMENGCEWRFHLPTNVGGFLCVASFPFRPILRHNSPWEASNRLLYTLRGFIHQEDQS